MFELIGKYNTAKVFTNNIEPEAISQIIELCNQEFVKESKIRIMPDVHAGAGCTVGTTMTVKDKVVPNLVGVDIGCGMLTTAIAEKEIDLEKLDKLIHDKIPAGFNIRKKKHDYLRYTDLANLRCIDHVDMTRAELSLGTLGGGNHFIEADRDDDGNIYIVIHSGSRRLGLEVAKYYQEEAYRYLNGSTKEDAEKLIAKLKSEGRHREIESELAKLKNVKRTSVPKHLAYLEGKLLQDYIYDMNIVQKYAMWNRCAMMDEIIDGMNLTDIGSFTTIHNYIAPEGGDRIILRKGAVAAYEGEWLLIPINMRDGSLICEGKSNPEWNYSAPHGAGRIMSRSQAKATFKMGDYIAEMKDVYTTSVSTDTLDECPMAYKNMQEIIDNIGDTVNVLKVIKPIYNFKAGGE